ncbi:putative lipid II flippase FtsW [Candidatus Magnetobacterium casense]|uniref:Probable peptidoglycan glycosyltransferase FtsW n=1 Tax=Candidatus Magnetobacterium casense TaxID=1455061 RepID=A0ABS6RVW9_9BACT|nr:putative lipid II flippase FtsW [Candidatus Magnetobacterium casensis]MBV6340772.1 putative lipid II flippase FtsW [Candidatus Magnetobacterium casensis]
MTLQGTRVNGQFDSVLLLTTAALVLTGVLMVYSSTSVVSPSARAQMSSNAVNDGQPAANLNLVDLRYLKKHLASVTLGILFMIIAYNLPIDIYRRRALEIFFIALVLLIAVNLPMIGATVNGARRWLRIWQFTFQPSEAMKLAVVILMARYLSSTDFTTDTVTVGNRLINFKAFIKPIILMVCIQAILLHQPDFGSAAIIGVITFTMLFLADVKLKYIFSVGLVFIPVVIKLVKEPYRLKRVLVFLDPWADERNSGFQLIQSFVALGNGGVHGVGLGKSMQKLYFLPESKTDFIFAIIGEETGLLGAVFVICLFVLFFSRAILIMNGLTDRFMFFMASGITLLIVLQALINMCVVTGMVPTKGLPMPFISYGGSSMIINLTEVGMLLNLANHTTVPRTESVTHGINTTRRVNHRKARVFSYDKQQQM